MTGWDEAKAWLAENAPDWRLQHGEASLKAGYTIGAPTFAHYEVELALRVPLSAEQIAEGEWDSEFDEFLRGEGGSYLEAVQNAVGVLDEAVRER